MAPKQKHSRTVTYILSDSMAIQRRCNSCIYCISSN